MMNDFTVGEWVAFSWMLEEARRAGELGVKDVKDSIIGQNATELYYAISGAVDKHCELHRDELEKTFEQAAQGSGEIEFGGVVDIEEVVERTVSGYASLLAGKADETKSPN